MKNFTVSSKKTTLQKEISTMWISRFNTRFLRAGLLALLAMATVSMGDSKVETAERTVAPVERPPMFVLQVGIMLYVHAAPLTGAVNDVVEMRKVLESDRYKVPPQNIVTLKDAEGTKKNIFDKFRTHLIGNARAHFEKTKKRDAVVMFQFSGHGSQVPDVDGDEKDDGEDETLVTVDSANKLGKNFDITDDEIFALTSELRRYTDNIVYVFDSCHSGSGTRNSEDVRRVEPRTTVPVVVDNVGVGTTRSEEKKPEDDASGVLPPGDDYIVITAARSGELASQRDCFEECGQKTIPLSFGNLTFYLIDELKRARADTSYRELMANVRRRVVAQKSTQTPQLEGDSSRFVFGGLGSKEDSYTAIAKGEPVRPAKTNRTVTIAAGAIQGVTPDTLVWFYDKAVTRFDAGKKLSAGRVKSVTAGEAVVELLGPVRPIAATDKARIVSPDLGSLKIKLNLEKDAATLTPVQKNIVAGIRSQFASQAAAAPEGSRSVVLPSSDLVSAGSWDVALLKDKFSTVASKVEGLINCETPDGKHGDDPTPPDREVFYLAGKDYMPLYRFCIDAMPTVQTDEAEVGQRIGDVLVHIARLRSIAAIANKSSSLDGKITVKPVKLIGPYKCVDGKFQAASSETPVLDSATGYYNFGPRQPYWFEVTNNSPFDLYVALLNFDPDGSVKLRSPRARAEEQAGIVIPKDGGRRVLIADDCRVNAAGEFLEAGASRTARIPGIDGFKFILSTDPLSRDSLKFLEMTAITDDHRGGPSPIASASDWTTVETFFQINDTSK
jgi:hypothetical protein